MTIHIEGSDLIRIGVAEAKSHTLEIDDAAGFQTPVLTRTFQGAGIALRAGEAGLIPGVRYRVRLDGQSTSFPLRPANPERAPAGINCDALKRTWRESGRFYVGLAYSQLKWDDSLRRWTPVVPAVPIGEALYNAELVLRPALSAARACNDLETMDEIALYYTAMLDKSQTIGSMLKLPNLLGESRLRMIGSDPMARTFSARMGPGTIGEGELFNSQWLHPAALLIRLISQLPEKQRTPGMRTFLKQFVPFIVHEQLLRFLIEQPMPELGGRPCRGRVERWELAMQGKRGERHWDTAMSDIDIWLLCSAAEMLGAHANDPQNIEMGERDVAALRRALQVGVRFFQTKRTMVADTKDFKGRTVGSASYFNGDYDGLPEMRGTAVTAKDYPGDQTAPAREGASWDIAHMYRIPIFLRTLYENRKATGVAFPQLRDIELVVNQYLYRVFNGDFDRPLFRNNFDGSDGWFRVGYNGSGSGQPPSSVCNMHDVRRLCMTPGNIVGWPELSFANADLAQLQRSLIKLGFDAKPETRTFLDRYYFWIAPFEMSNSTTGGIYCGAFYAIAAENADMFLPAESGD